VRKKKKKKKKKFFFVFGGEKKKKKKRGGGGGGGTAGCTKQTLHLRTCELTGKCTCKNNEQRIATSKPD